MRLLLIAGLILAANTVPADDAPPKSRQQYRLTFPAALRATPFSGRVVLYFSKTRQQPREGLSWFNPEILVGRDVINWRPGEPLIIDSTKPEEVVTCPQPLDQLDLTGWRVQAVARFNLWERRVGDAPGNGFSETIVVPPAVGETPLDLAIQQLVPERSFPENDGCRLLKMRSKLLSEFYQFEVWQHAAVLLPASYATQPERKYPVIFAIPGFGGNHLAGVHAQAIPEQNAAGVEFIRVTLDPSCPLGHHAFADSANNGPRGTAFVTEFLPELDRQFRTDPRPQARFLTGHSSGGWSSLWMMITHPDQFAGTWSISPDPVTFEDFQNINLYSGQDNMYVDRHGERRPIARRGNTPVLWYREFDLMEQALGPGGQLHSFEAVFSPRGADGRPLRVWNRQSGQVDAAAARHWEKYDICRILERDWPTLGAKLKGKLHIHMGDQDTFYLEGATHKLGETMKELGETTAVEMHPGKDHGNLMNADFVARIRREIVQAYLSAE